ncbi:protein-S-isoprenylcysteine methyltransferase [Stenotrophomonas sp. ESTM1D_MKCIP4_1]|uniref:methyltransferase family protein n=1 Tax=Stenotrophomonas sp. ESTM1D_MKCIP4_1 TaxID=2072414 RepID=UPI000D5422A4|nr:isoprenylcysteine carboxylmethyltransferase family protein [Stenotrophomonas sp. ESTM1D_MKCIP4_1]AWH53139.1 protein-S-isoprenylcysteine methyltransferase [Stenotrophomonas sp. ESTM1D_MKCIP4_1]
MHLLETRIPPPLLMLLCGAMGYLLARVWPWPVLPVPGWIAVLVMLAGLALNLLPKLAFRRARTTVNPLRPAAATALVTEGIYRHTRNPMYLGQGLVLLGAMLWLGSAAALLVVPMFVGWITRFQIVPEEQVLSARFGVDYADFRRRVRRWG